MANYFDNWTDKEVLVLLDNSKLKVLHSTVEQVLIDLSLLKSVNTNYPLAIVELQQIIQNVISKRFTKNLM